MAGLYAYSIITPSGIAQSDYNDLFTTGPKLAFWDGDCFGLSELQSTNGQDQHSVSTDPLFKSVTDLHVSHPRMNNIGTPIDFITDDVDGDVRDANTPDIGADEFKK